MMSSFLPRYTGGRGVVVSLRVLTVWTAATTLFAVPSLLLLAQCSETSAAVADHYSRLGRTSSTTVTPPRTLGILDDDYGHETDPISSFYRQEQPPNSTTSTTTTTDSSTRQEGISTSTSTTTTTSNAVVDRYPYFVGLWRDRWNYCGGSLVDAEWVLVAAQCAPNMELDNLVIGQYFYLASNFGQAATENHRFDAVYYHTTTHDDSDNDDSNTDHPSSSPSAEAEAEATAAPPSPALDLALLHLTTKSNIPPVTLDGGSQKMFEPSILLDMFLTANRDDFHMPEDLTLTTIGVGRLRRTGRLPTFTQAVNVSHVDGADCEERWSNDTDIILLPDARVSKDLHICAEGMMGSGICNGDSGGPIILPGMAPDGSDDIQVGLTTTSTTPCIDGIPEVYTRLGTEAVHTWIQETKKDYKNKQQKKSSDNNDGRRRRQLRLKHQDELRSLQKEVATFNGMDLQPRIVGGYQAPPNRYPYYVGIWNQNQQYCGGSLIDDEWVLTAAHCSVSVGHTLVIGQYFYMLGNHGQQSEHRTIDAAYGYPLYNAAEKASFDVGLIHFHQKSTITPISVDGLVTKSKKQRSKDEEQPLLLLYDDDPLEAIGTGQVYRGSTFPNFLQSVELPYVNNSFCDNVMTEEIANHHICAGGEIGFGTCFGGK
jgi:secreted trypsin-like serine protease